ncbi:MAG: methyltransferase domain-containing protein [bacterium]|nr:methyltransferase domain-containing protein [bacterium]
MLIKNTKSISSIKYTKSYFTNEVDWKILNDFISGGNPRSTILKAYEYLKKFNRGLFLDIGCGRGELVVLLWRMRKKAIGIDYSKSSINLCNELYKDEIKKYNIRFLRCSATNLQFADQTFKGVYMLDIVEHLTPQQLNKSLSEAYRVLDKNGYLVIHTNNKYFERITKPVLVFLYFGIKFIFNPNKYLEESKHTFYEYMHINYLKATELDLLLRKIGYKTKIEYVKPEDKEGYKMINPFQEKWKNILVQQLASRLGGSIFDRYISPTYWVIARK